MKLLILSSSGFGHGSMYPFVHYKKELDSSFGLNAKEIICDNLQEKLQHIKKIDCQIVIITIPWNTDRTKAHDFYEEVARIKDRKRIIHFDFGDGNQSPFFGILPYVDLYLKQYLSRDVTDYDKRFLGASQFIEYLVNKGIVENSIQSEIWTNLFQSKIPKAHANKLILGWNFALWKRMIYLAEGRKRIVTLGFNTLPTLALSTVKEGVDRLRSTFGLKNECIDVYCRANLYKGWTKTHREMTIEMLNRLPSKYNVLSSIQRVSLGEYYREMERSKIFVSPSGWCEYTPKDYEAMLFKTLLIKPSVEHIVTEPDVLIPDETYVPVKWDMSDLNEKCEYYLNHEKERLRIADRAFEVISSYYRSKAFLRKIRQAIDTIDMSEREND